MYGQAGGGPGRRHQSGWVLLGAAIAVVSVGALFGVALATGKIPFGSTSAPTPQAVAATSAVPVTSPAEPGPSPSTAAPSQPATQAPGPSSPPPPAKGSLAAAKATVRGLGYTPNPDTGKHWDNSATLNVIVGILTGSADGHPAWAFFFVDGHYIGTDTELPSALINLAWTHSDTVALTYLLYAPADPMCCPSAGTATVRYHWNGSHLAPLDPIPPAGGTGPSRRSP